VVRANTNSLVRTRVSPSRVECGRRARRGHAKWRFRGDGTWDSKAAGAWAYRRFCLRPPYSCRVSARHPLGIGTGRSPKQHARETPTPTANHICGIRQTVTGNKLPNSPQETSWRDGFLAPAPPQREMIRLSFNVFAINYHYRYGLVSSNPF
jgi:hypothetical protein